MKRINNKIRVLVENVFRPSVVIAISNHEGGLLHWSIVQDSSRQGRISQRRLPASSKSRKKVNVLEFHPNHPVTSSIPHHGRRRATVSATATGLSLPRCTAIQLVSKPDPFLTGTTVAVNLLRKVEKL